MSEQDQYTEGQRAEAFRQFQVGHLERQTTAAERTAKSTDTIRLLVQIWFWVTVGLFALYLIAGLTSDRF